MKLSGEQKYVLLHVAKQVYFAYLALDFFKSKECIFTTHSESTSDGHPETLFQIINNLVFPLNSTNVPVRIADRNWILEVRATAAEGFFQVTLRQSLADSSVVTKFPNDYSDEEVGDLLVNKTFVIEVISQEKFAVSLPFTAEHTIGGAKKFDLYRPHLVTLFNIIQKIEREEDLSCLLVALATGSGKTFVQALWLCILSLAGLNGVFAIPDKLILQFRKDLNRLLPDTLTANIIILRDSDPATKIVEALNKLRRPGVIMIASSKLILDKHYARLMVASPDYTHFIFDEQHLLMANERRRGRLLALAQQYLSVFLTATPNPETYAISGKKPVAIMSSGQKQKAGQGQFPHMLSMQCEFVADLHRKQVVEFSVGGHVKSVVESLMLRFDHAIQPECSSAILTAFKELPYVMKRKENEQDLRWRLQVPMASKILCIVDDNETLVNCCHYLQCDSANSNVGHVYHNGNFLESKSVSEIFSIPNIGLQVVDQQQAEQRRQYLEQLNADERAILEPLLTKGLRQQLHANMFHYLVEYVLSDLSGRNLIENNQLRKQSEEEFKNLIVRNYELKDQVYFYDKLCLEIDSRGALIISSLLAKISKRLETLIDNEPQTDLVDFTSNWFLNDQMLSSMGERFKGAFTDYANEYVVMGVMSGMEESETPILDSQPFLGLSEERYSLYANAGMQASRAKRRQRTSIELLNDRAQESKFTPKYDVGMTKDISDNYIRLGFIGLCVSNMHTEGFSDANLHTIINLAEHSHDSNNNPISLIQGIGRARGLDEMVLPFYIHALGHAQASSFDLNLLAKDDYYPELFRAQEEFKQSYIAILGEQVAKDMIAWYHQHQEGDESIDPDMLKRKVLHLVASALRRLNIQENHHIHRSRAQLTKVIAYAMEKLDKEIAHTKRPYRLSLFIRIVGTIINFVCECYFTVLRFKPWLAMLWHAWTLDQTQALQADEVYLKIIRHAHFKDLIAQGLVAAEFKAWFMRKTNTTKSVIEKSSRYYLNQEIRANVDDYLNSSVLPLFEKMVVPEKRAIVRDKLHKFDGLLFLLKENEKLLQNLEEEHSDAQFSELILPLLHKVPGLEWLDSSDVVNYPNRVKATITWFQQSPHSKLSEDRALKEEVALTVSAFLQDELPKYIGSFVTYSDKQKILAALSNKPENIRVFTDRYIEQCTANPESADDFSVLFACFQQCFDLEDVMLLPQRIEETKGLLQAYQLGCIADVMLRELLPTLVNLYPLASREGLLAQITPEKVENLLRTHQDEMRAVIAANNPSDMAAFLFKTLCTRVPAQINLVQEKERSALFFAQQTQGWSGVSNTARYAVDYLSRKLTGADLGLLSSRVQTLLISNGFFESISLLLPFHHWSQLKRRFIQEPTNVGKLALKLAAYVDKPGDLTPEILLQEINTAFGASYQSTQDYGSAVGEYLRRLSAGEKTVCATSSQRERLTPIIRSHCLPLLASYIRSDALKEQLLLKVYDSPFLCDFFVGNFAGFLTLADLSSGQQRQLVQQFLNHLYPNLISINDLVDPKEYGEEQAHSCKTALMHKVKTVFCMSAICKNKLSEFLNDSDAQIMQATLSIRQEAEEVAGLLPETSSKMDSETMLERVRAGIPSLNNVCFLSERVQQFKIEMEKVLNLKEKALDSRKLADLAMEQMQPILGHAQFISLIALYMGSLNARDLEIIFSARNYSNAAEAARTLLRFKVLIEQKDFTTFKQEFMECAPEEVYDFEHSPLKTVLDNFAVLAEEVVRCHCYYQQHDEKGMQESDTVTPGFFRFVSASIKDIRVPVFDDFMSNFSRRIFFIQGVRNGLPLAGQVFSDSSKEILETLQRIKNHLLRPLWWSVNTPGFIYNLLLRVQGWVSFLQNTVSKIIQAGKEMQIWILGELAGSQTQTEVKDDIEGDFTVSALATAKIINDLEPLTKEQIAASNCPKDVITDVERAVNRLPSHRMRLFAQRRVEPQQGHLSRYELVF